MNVSQSVEVSDDQLAAAHRRRKRIAGAASAVMASVYFSGLALKDSLGPIAGGLVVAAIVILSIVVFVLWIRANQCVKCGGGIKLDGITCSRCGQRY